MTGIELAALGLGAAAAFFAVVGAIAAAVLYVGKVTDDKVNALALSLDRIYAQRADMTRVEARMHAIESAVEDVRKYVHAIYERTNGA